MKHRNLRLCLLSALGFSIFWGACTKSTSLETNPNSVDSVSSASRVSLLTLSAWKYDTSGYDGNKDGVIDRAADTAVVPVCERDDLETFYTNFTGSLDNGADDCSASGSRLASFTWSLDSTQTVLTASINSIMDEGVNILKLDSTQLSVYRDSTYSGTSYRYIVIFKH